MRYWFIAAVVASVLFTSCVKEFRCRCTAGNTVVEERFEHARRKQDAAVDCMIGVDEYANRKKVPAGDTIVCRLVD